VLALWRLFEEKMLQTLQEEKQKPLQELPEAVTRVRVIVFASFQKLRIKAKALQP